MDVIITGCSRGIGFELVKAFLAASESRVLAISRNVNSLHKLSADHAGKLFPVSLDLSSEGFTQQLGEVIHQLEFRPAVLINNAGLLVNKPFNALQNDDFDQMFAINVKAPFQLIRFLLPHFMPGSHIVNIGSMGGFQGSVKFQGLSLYSASKAALAVLTECLATELNDYNIRCNCLALGAAQTEMLEQAFPGYNAPVSANDMADFIFHFARESHHFINGKIIPVSLSTP